MKPIVFLSHSKVDKAFIEKLADDLRAARVEVWVDEWEIPPGEPFRKHIFEDGIPSSDLFFVYLTSKSVDSYWVVRELDAAIMRDAESKGGSITLFVDSDETRKKLSIDLQSLHSPILNDEVYCRPLSQLISRAWESKVRKQARSMHDSYRLELLQLEKESLELKVHIAKLEEPERIDLDELEKKIELFELAYQPNK